MFRPQQQPEQQQRLGRRPRGVPSIPTRQVRAKRMVPVLRRRYPKKARIAESRKVLDSWQLLQASNGKYPEKATEVHAEGLGFTDVVDADFALFANLEFVELSDNSVALADVLRFPKLHDLYLNCNGICAVPDLAALAAAQPRLFPAKLTHLSLAFNRLRAASIANLCAAFAELVSLNLAHNELTALPPQLRSLRHLRNLNLSHNELGGAAAWRVLASLPALAELDLSENRFAQVPSVTAGFAQLEFLNLSANRVRRSEHILPIQRLPRIAVVDLRRNAFLDEIWSAIKLRKSAQKRSQRRRYENVFVPRSCQLAGDRGAANDDDVELPRPCDFGRIYWEIVLSRGIVVVVDDPEHQNVFELQPILKEHGSRSRSLSQSRYALEHDVDEPRSEASVRRASFACDSALDTNVASLLQTQLSAKDCCANKVVAECMEQMHKLLYK